MPKQARALPAPRKAALSRGGRSQRHLPLRGMAKTDYVTDPHCRSVQFHYERKDREYSVVSIATFKSWSVEDDWIALRRKFWEEIEVRTRERKQDEIYEQRKKDEADLSELYGVYIEYLRPLRDKHGKMLIDAKTGLPQFPLPMPRADQLMRMLLQVHERLLLLRGEISGRASMLNEDAALRLAEDESAPEPTASQLSRAEMRAVVRRLIEEQQRLSEDGHALRDGVPSLQDGTALRRAQEAGR